MTCVLGGVSAPSLAIASFVVLAACASAPPPGPPGSGGTPGAPSPTGQPLVACGDDAPVGEAPVSAFFACVDDDAQPPWDVYPVPRQAQAADPVSRLEAALLGLLGGPTAEEVAAGYWSFFSERTAGALNGVRMEADGTAVVDFADFRRFLGTASTSAGMQGFLAQLNATVLQIEEVTAVDYRIDGSCASFWEWLQSSCQIVERPAS